jgi:hypothetical protein
MAAGTVEINAFFLDGTANETGLTNTCLAGLGDQ